jgi:AcrR family transcriptional regulator
MENKRDRKSSANLILEAAIEEFSQYGLAGARIERIAERARVNKAMIYYHFRSKELLYQTIIERHLDKLRHFFKERMVWLDDPEDLFRNLAEFYNSQFVNPVFIPILLREIASGGERIINTFAEFMAEGPMHKLRSFIEGSIEQGSFRKIDSRQTIASFIGMNLFYLIMSPLINKILEIGNEKDFKENRSEAIVDLFFNGVRKK